MRARLLDLTDGAKNMTLNDDLEKSEKQRMDLFYEYVKAKRDAQVIEIPATQKEILSEAERFVLNFNVFFYVNDFTSHIYKLICFLDWRSSLRHHWFLQNCFSLRLLLQKLNVIVCCSFVSPIKMLVLNVLFSEGLNKSLLSIKKYSC